MNLEHGVFTVSLDFELYWGVRDKRSIDQYKDNLQGVRNAVHQMLRIFSDNHIHATWATVGFLFFSDMNELKDNIPKILPEYNNEELSPYKYIDRSPVLNLMYHFGPDLIDHINTYDGQEIATHTFSHYYCLEEGQSVIEFDEDILSAIKIAKHKGISIKSLVFPRNQWNPEYLAVLNDRNINCYRGNESHWIYKASDDANQSVLRKAFRLIDSYINISGQNVYDLRNCISVKPFNFPSSRLLRPYSRNLSILDGLKFTRIRNSMSYAAKHNKIFHLWWHPHNFGLNTSENMAFLSKIINHYKFLNTNYGMKSLNMNELSKLADGK